MSDFFSADLDADLAIARVQQQIADAQATAAKAQSMQADIQAIRGTATAPRRELSVTVDAAGRLSAVEIADAAYDLEPRELGALIVATANAAQRRAGEQALQIAADAFGEESSVVAHLRAEVDRVPPSDADEISGVRGGQR